MDEIPKGRGAKGGKKDEEERAEPEARAIDVKVKGADDGAAMLAGNLELLKRMQEEKWKKFDWMDAEVCFQHWLNISRHISYLTFFNDRRRNLGRHMIAT